VSRRTSCAAVALALIVFAGACSSDDQSTESSDETYRMQALSTRAEYVTGGDVLVGIEAPGGAALDGMAVTVDGRDVSSAFAMEGGRLVGLVDGLADGSSTIVAERDGGRVELEVVNHSTTGPLFSGPHLEPFVCKTEMFGLGPPTDDNCSATTQSRTEDVGGVSATIERGVIDRSIYTIVHPNDGWNGRLVYRFGGGCGTSYSQGSSLVNAVDPALVQKGYAVVTSTLNTYQSVCNEVLSAEVALMTKEHFIEQFGVPEFTIGEGGSGGAIQQLQVAQNYPGILDAVAPAVPFADALSTAPTVTDCGLLLAYFATPGGASFSDEQQRAVSGHRNFDTCRLWARAFLPNIDPTVGCDPAIPREEIYNSESNRDGVRCTLQDSAINLGGTDPTTGFAARPLDNTGVVYGRGAFDDEVISFEQLVELNAGIGGYDIDGKVVPTRTTAPDSWFETAYATGRVTEGGGLVDVPILLTNIYTDALGDIHDRQRAFSIRERLATAEGAQPENVVIWTFPSRGSLNETLSGAVGDTSAAIEALDQWLTAARADAGSGTWSEKLARNRPEPAVDTCVLANGERLAGDGVYTASNGCTAEYPVGSDARRVAGAPLRDDILKCQTVPLDASYFERSVTDEQLEQLRAVFPDGVCDWTRPGIGQVPLSGTWLAFEPRDVEPS
jgi:hypothetical protein